MIGRLNKALVRVSLLALLTVALFYSHVVPFGLCGIGYVALFPWSRPKAWVRAAAPWIPVMPLAVWWTFGTDAGRITSGALFDTSGVAHKPLISSAVDFDRWVIDVFMDSSGQRVFFALMVVAIAAIALAATGQDRPAPVARSYVCLPLACLVCYLALAEGHDYVFFIAQRFPVLLLMTAIPLLPMPSGWPGRAITAAAAVLAVASVVNVSRHFQHFEREEVGAFDLAIAEMTPNSRVCALIYEPASRIMRDAPFLHFGSYYQVQKGGVVMFTYAGYAHWPIDFAPGKYPPPGRPARLRWEWTPASVPIAEVYPYYDFVLTRGHGFRPPAGTYHLVRKDENWAVWARDVPAR